MQTLFGYLMTPLHFLSGRQICRDVLAFQGDKILEIKITKTAKHKTETPLLFLLAEVQNSICVFPDWGYLDLCNQMVVETGETGS
jgi:hypothetical protein